MAVKKEKPYLKFEIKVYNKKVADLFRAFAQSKGLSLAQAGRLIIFERING